MNISRERGCPFASTAYECVQIKVPEWNVRCETSDKCWCEKHYNHQMCCLACCLDNMAGVYIDNIFSKGLQLD